MSDMANYCFEVELSYLRNAQSSKQFIERLRRFFVFIYERSYHINDQCTLSTISYVLVMY